MRRTAIHMAVVALILGLMASMFSAAGARSFSPWGPAQNAERPGGSANLNTAALEGCPIETRNGLMLFFASNRPGGMGGLDIWIATRASVNDPWGEPFNPGAPVNSEADDFCPTPTTSRMLYFVSSRAGGCGGPDIYRVSIHPRTGWGTPENLGCTVNSPAAEFSPSVVRINGVPHLYFSSNRPGGFSSQAPDNDHDIYVSRFEVSGGVAAWTSPELVPGLNSAFDDARPNVRWDGLEIVFDSNRPGGLGGPDIWSSQRDSTHSQWGDPVNLGPNVNSPAAEARPSLSRDGRRLLFGSNREGGEGNSDLYYSTRERAPR